MLGMGSPSCIGSEARSVPAAVSQLLVPDVTPGAMALHRRSESSGRDRGRGLQVSRKGGQTTTSVPLAKPPRRRQGGLNDRWARAGSRRSRRDPTPGIRCMTTVSSVTCRTTPGSWQRTGADGSADPGLGMNRTPHQLTPRFGCLVLVSVAGSPGTTLCASLENLEKQRQEPARALMAADLIVR